MAFWQSASVSTAVATHRAMTRAAGRPQFHMDMMIAGARPASIYRLVWRMVRPLLMVPMKKGVATHHTIQ